MTDSNREDTRSDLQRAVEARSDEADAAEGGADTSALESAGAGGGENGAGGVVKNQAGNQQ